MSSITTSSSSHSQNINIKPIDSLAKYIAITVFAIGLISAITYVGVEMAPAFFAGYVVIPLSGMIYWVKTLYKPIVFPPIINGRTLDLTRIPPAWHTQFQALDKGEKAIQMIKDQIGKRDRLPATTVFSSELIKTLAPIFNEVFKDFQKFQSEYGTCPELSLHTQKVGDQVLNDKDVGARNNTYAKKYRILLGWQNMLHFGPQILDQFHEVAFKNHKDSYDNGKGLKRVEYLAGNTVDLEQELSATTDKEAISEARQKVEFFKLRFAELPNLVRDRPNTEIPREGVLAKHTSKLRGKGSRPMWTRQGTNGSTYFVNVPNVDDVVDAILLAPLRFLLSYCTIKYLSGAPGQESELTDQQRSELKKLFDDGIPQLCLNGQAASIIKASLPYLTKVYKMPKTPVEQQVDMYGQAAIDRAFTRDDLMQKFVKIRNEEQPLTIESCEMERLQDGGTRTIRKVKNNPFAYDLMPDPDAPGYLNVLSPILPEQNAQVDSKDWILQATNYYYKRFVQNGWILENGKPNLAHLYKTVDADQKPTSYQPFSGALANKLAREFVDSDTEDRFRKTQ